MLLELRLDLDLRLGRDRCGVRCDGLRKGGIETVGTQGGGVDAEAG